MCVSGFFIHFCKQRLHCTSVCLCLFFQEVIECFFFFYTPSANRVSNACMHVCVYVFVSSFPELICTVQMVPHPLLFISSSLLTEVLREGGINLPASVTSREQNLCC